MRSWRPIIILQNYQLPVYHLMSTYMISRHPALTFMYPSVPFVTLLFLYNLPLLCLKISGTPRKGAVSVSDTYRTLTRVGNTLETLRTRLNRVPFYFGFVHILDLVLLGFKHIWDTVCFIIS